MYLSRDDGKTWEPFKQVPFSNIHRICFNPDDKDHILLSTFGASVIRAPTVP